MTSSSSPETCSCSASRRGTPTTECSGPCQEPIGPTSGFRQAGSTSPCASQVWPPPGQHSERFRGPMPEGDVVWRTSRQLDAALAGRPLTRSDFRVPRFATTNLVGREVHEAVSRGKHLLIRVDGDVTVHTHLRMDGSWRIRPATGYAPNDHRVRLVL